MRRTWGTIQAAYDVGAPPETHLLRRGNHETPGPLVEPGFLSVLCTTDAARPATSFSPATVSTAPVTSGRRLALARWLTDWKSPAGGLAARVMVNRVWQNLFGRGIAETSENLGRSGSAPSHPELLEYLACQFVAEGRHVKPLIKQIMLSAVYRQSAEPLAADSPAANRAAEVDPTNRLLWRMPLRRLEAEIVRDAILAASGRLDTSLGGPPLPLETRSDGLVVLEEKKLPTPTAACRRSLYILARRNYHLSMLGVFDEPTMSTNCTRRQQSAVVLQSLAMLNDGFVLEEATQFARRVLATAGRDSRPAQIDLAFRIALGRPPSAAEVELEPGPRRRARDRKSRSQTAPTRLPSARWPTFVTCCSTRTSSSISRKRPGSHTMFSWEHSPYRLSRRQLLAASGMGLGSLALSFLLQRDRLLAATASSGADLRPSRASSPHRPKP